MKKTQVLITCAIFGIAIQVCSGKSLDDPFLYSTVFIKNQSTRGAGTGFLVRRQVSKDRLVVYLLSNKHVLLPSPIDPNQKDHLANAEIQINKSVSNQIRKATITIVLRDSKGNLLVKGHSDPNVDVAAVNVTKAIEASSGIAFAISEDRFATKAFVKRNFISVGDQALIIGYPLNLVEQGHVTPVTRNAIIATKPDQQFRGLSAFLVDGTVLRGSSGSPVLLPIRPYVWSDSHKVNIGTIQENYLLGIAKGHIKDWEMIIRKTITPEVVQEFTIVDNAQLGIVSPADTILEVVELFGFKKWQE